MDLATHIQDLQLDDALVSSKVLNVLDDHFSSWESLRNYTSFDALLAHTRNEATVLRQDLGRSTEALDTQIQSALARLQQLLLSAQDVALARYIITDELQALSSELISSSNHGLEESTLLEDLDTLQRSLRETESVRSYVKVIERTLVLREAALHHFEQNSGHKQVTQVSLSGYVQLQEFVENVERAVGETSRNSETISLVVFAESLRDQTWTDIKGKLSEALLVAAEKLNWPMKVSWGAAAVPEREAFANAFLNLLELQELGEKMKPMPGDGLYPLATLVRSVALRFKFHFEGDRQTNRLDKPEWYFSHILNILHDQRAFMETTIQTLLGLTSYSTINAYREFTTLLFPVLARKMKRSMNQLLRDPRLLAQTIYQALAFDSQLIEDGFSLAGTTSSRKDGENANWEGISDVILGNKEWFDAWLEAEREFAEEQYNEIIQAQDAWHISDDGESDERHRDLRPTNSARRVKALLDQVSDRYQVVPRFHHRARFLIAIQIPILEQYHTRISSSLDAFEALSSTLMGVVPGALAGQGGPQFDRKRLIDGVEGLQRLLKAFVSARWITMAMQSWGEMLASTPHLKLKERPLTPYPLQFYLEMWNEINKKAALRAKAQTHPSLPDPAPEHNAEGTLFDELIAQYAALTARSEDMVIRHVVGGVGSELRTHLASAWPSSREELLVPNTLLGPVTSLQTQLAFLATTLPPSSVSIFYRQIASGLSTHIYSRVFKQRSRGKLTEQNGQTIEAEAQLWLQCCRQVVGKVVRRVDVPWQDLLEAARLASIPEGPSFVALVQIAWHSSASECVQKFEEAGVQRLSREQVKEVLSARLDYVP